MFDGTRRGRAERGNADTTTSVSRWAGQPLLPGGPTGSSLGMYPATGSDLFPLASIGGSHSTWIMPRSTRPGNGDHVILRFQMRRDRRRTNPS
jgi:hypothetical protein